VAFTPWSASPTTERDAKRALREVLVAADKGELVDPSKEQVGAYLDEWLAGLRLAPSTVASYCKNVRLRLRQQLPPSRTQLHWSRWRRRHQATARACHYRRRALTPA
jgi:hypothetical protein